ncbi:hypothetical protein Lal_00044994 [Lupinus albus]|nr:hypothetical protein Lal_00044994 [Lupinus albus]
MPLLKRLLVVKNARARDRRHRPQNPRGAPARRPHHRPGSRGTGRSVILTDPAADQAPRRCGHPEGLCRFGGSGAGRAADLGLRFGEARTPARGRIGPLRAGRLALAGGGGMLPDDRATRLPRAGRGARSCRLRTVPEGQAHPPRRRRLDRIELCPWPTANGFATRPAIGPIGFRVADGAGHILRRISAGALHDDVALVLRRLLVAGTGGRIAPGQEIHQCVGARVWLMRRGDHHDRDDSR